MGFVAVNSPGMYREGLLAIVVAPVKLFSVGPGDEQHYAGNIPDGEYAPAIGTHPVGVGHVLGFEDRFVIDQIRE